MTRLPYIFLLVLTASIVFSSCDNDFEDEVCTCPHGGTIGGWEGPDDTTSVHQNDSTKGFVVSLEDWGNSETHDISIE
ncbi:MAG: hypothetical protein J5954_02010 [Prevotella sp.]|nr:hypothetical protein [Prevotella sp.]